jgi:hypothetical protein
MFLARQFRAVKFQQINDALKRRFRAITLGDLIQPFL